MQTIDYLFSFLESYPHLTLVICALFLILGFLILVKNKIGVGERTSIIRVIGIAIITLSLIEIIYKMLILIPIGTSIPDCFDSAKGYMVDCNNTYA